MRLEPVHHTVVAMDVAGSGHRDDLLQLRMRADLRAIVAETLAAQSLDVAALHHTDLGDGIRLIAPASISPPRCSTRSCPTLPARCASTARPPPIRRGCGYGWRSTPACCTRTPMVGPARHSWRVPGCLTRPRCGGS
jgi:hypothetical protein